MVGPDPNGEPTKPDLNIVKVNMDGTLYTWKLAVHYFRKQPDTDDRDRCFIITGSMVAWIDSPVKHFDHPSLRYLQYLRYVCREIGNILQLNMVFVASCGPLVAPAGSKASGSTTLPLVGSKVQYVLQNMKSGSWTMALNLVSRKIVLAAC